MVAKPSIFFSSNGSTASGVTSRPVKPVPPVEITTSMKLSAIQAFPYWRGAERIAGRQFALREADGEPVFALLRRAVGKRVRHDASLRVFLQRVVADRAGGLQRRIDVAGIEELFALLDRK